MNINVTTDELFARIGSLTIANERLTAEVVRLQAELAASREQAAHPEGSAK